MTNEEISNLAIGTMHGDERSIGLIEMLCRDDVQTDEIETAEELIEDTIRKAIAQAYEEAAQAASAKGLEGTARRDVALPDWFWKGYYSACDDSAGRVRALKNSLVAEPVS